MLVQPIHADADIILFPLCVSLLGTLFEEPVLCERPERWLLLAGSCFGPRQLCIHARIRSGHWTLCLSAGRGVGRPAMGHGRLVAAGTHGGISELPRTILRQSEVL